MSLKLTRSEVCCFNLLLRIIYFVPISYLCLAPWRFASHYDYIDKNCIYDSLVQQSNRNISLQPLEDCNYISIIKDNKFAYFEKNRKQILNINEINHGGEYYPQECRARFSSAIIVPYRQRKKQLHDFLIYMHNYLRKQMLHYRIFVVEQYDKKPFNRAKLFNIGSVIASTYEFPCLIFHDVDLMPLKLGQLYACSEQPRHMCSGLDAFRFNLPYIGLFGGVVSIRTEHFHFMNGMSNVFDGWGGEDDDFFERLKSRNDSICRFHPGYSGYTMLKHKKEIPNDQRLDFLKNGKLRYNTDGLNSLIYINKGIYIRDLFTHISVET